MRIKNNDDIRQYFNCYISLCCAYLRFATGTAKLETVDSFDVRKLITNGEHLVTVGQQLERYLKNNGVPKVYVDEFGREIPIQQAILEELYKQKQKGEESNAE